MMERKMDLNEFIKEQSMMYGERNCDVPTFDKFALLRFVRDSRGNISSRCRFGTVYPHKGCENLIKVGDVWLCILKSSPNTPNVYFGDPVQKLDLYTICEFSQGQMEALVDFIWKDYRSHVLDELDARYCGMVTGRSEDDQSLIDGLEQRIATLTLEKEGLMSEVASLHNEVHLLIEEMHDLRAENRSLEGRLESALADNTVLNDAFRTSKMRERDHLLRIETLESEALRSSTMSERKVQTIGRPYSSVVQVVGAEKVVRAGSNTLYSTVFMDGRFKARFSMDRNHLKLVPDELGESVCSCNEMEIRGLDVMVPIDTNAEFIICSVDQHCIVLDIVS